MDKSVQPQHIVCLEYHKLWTEAPGLYPGQGVYARPGFYPKFYGNLNSQTGAHLDN